MTNDFDNNDDFVEPEIGMPEGEPKKTSAMGNLAEAWRTRPLFKFMVLVVGLFAIGSAAINLFGEEKTAIEAARLSKPPALNEAPGGVVSPYMRRQTELASADRAKKARESGGSAIPTPLGQTQGGLNAQGGLDAQGGSANGTMSRQKRFEFQELRAETERLKRQLRIQEKKQSRKNMKLAQKEQQASLQQQEEQDNTLAEAMQRQMQQLLNSWAPTGIKNVQFLAGSSTLTEKGLTAAPATQTTAPEKQVKRKTLVKAGTVNYAQLLTEANSDVPGPILAQIVSGPLTGARAIGAFQVSDGYEKYIVMRFKLANKRGKDYTIDAIALDPETTLGGMATEVDERYFSRVVLPAAAAFLQGMGDAMSQGESSITTAGDVTITTQSEQGTKEGIYKGLSKGADTIGQFFQQRANVTKPLVRVSAGTPFGLFFVSTVYEPLKGGASLGTPPSTPEENPSKVTTSGAVSITKPDAAVDWNKTVPYPDYANKKPPRRVSP